MLFNTRCCFMKTSINRIIIKELLKKDYFFTAIDYKFLNIETYIQEKLNYRNYVLM